MVVQENQEEMAFKEIQVDQEKMAQWEVQAEMVETEKMVHKEPEVIHLHLLRRFIYQRFHFKTVQKF